LVRAVRQGSTHSLVLLMVVTKQRVGCRGSLDNVTMRADQMMRAVFAQRWSRLRLPLDGCGAAQTEVCGSAASRLSH